MTQSEQAAYAKARELAKSAHDGTFTCTELGESLWGTDYRNRQCYARPAGRVIRRLIALGVVREVDRRQSDGRWKRAFAVSA